MKLSATDLVPTFGPVGAGGSPTLFVTRWPINENEIPSLYWEYRRQEHSKQPISIGEVTLKQTNLRVGVAYVITGTFETSTTPHTEILYGLLRGSSEWRLIFVVPAEYRAQYEDVFHDIAMTFDIAD